MKNIASILGYGIPSKVFNDRFDLLPADKKKIIERVARRLQTINKLNFETLVISNPRPGDETRFTFWRFELSSIQIYLYCTCIDTLANKIDGKYLDFYQWLKTQGAFILNADNIDEFHTEYLEEYGDKRNFSKIFTNLQPSIKSWLNQNVTIQSFNENKVLLEKREEDLIKYLTDYFYKSWRNPFTHQSVTQPVDFVSDINSYDQYFSKINESSKDEWFRQPAYFHLNGEKLSLWHKKDIDITFILRVIVQSVVFEWLGLNMNEDIINMAVYRFHRLHWLYSYIHEIRINADYLESWKEIREHHFGDYLSNLRIFGISSLSSMASSKLTEYFYANNPFENQQRDYLQEYILCINKINSQIDSFTKKHPYPKKIDRELENIAREETKDFLLSLTRRDEYTKIIKHSRTPWRFWELIHINSEYESINMPQSWYDTN